MLLRVLCNRMVILFPHLCTFHYLFNASQFVFTWRISISSNVWRRGGIYTLLLHPQSQVLKASWMILTASYILSCSASVQYPSSMPLFLVYANIELLRIKLPQVTWTVEKDLTDSWVPLSALLPMFNNFHQQHMIERRTLLTLLCPFNAIASVYSHLLPV